MVEALSKHKINKFLYFGVKKWCLNNSSCTIRNYLLFTEIGDSDEGKKTHENLSLICKSFQSLQEFVVNNTKKYAKQILNLFWVVYIEQFKLHYSELFAFHRNWR